MHALEHANTAVDQSVETRKATPLHYKLRIYVFGTGSVRDSSNSGVLGSLLGTRIVDLPQATMPGIHAIKHKLLVVNGQIGVRPIWSSR